MRSHSFCLAFAPLVVTSLAAAPSAAQDDPCAGRDLDACVEEAGALVGDDAAVARAVSIYRGACNHLHAAGCRYLGELYVAGRGVPAELQRATAMFETSCAGDDVRGCFDLASALASPDASVPDVPRALRLFEQTCDAHVGEAC